MRLADEDIPVAVVRSKPVTGSEATGRHGLWLDIFNFRLVGGTRFFYGIEDLAK
jgi:hypothetical protein